MAEAPESRFHMAVRSEALAAWRVTTPDLHIAAEVARLLGGRPLPVRTPGRDGGFEVQTDTPTVRVVIGSVDERSIRFRLTDGYGLGVFRFVYAPRMVRELPGGLADHWSGAGWREALVELTITPVEIQTRTGMIVLHPAPAVKVLGPSA